MVLSDLTRQHAVKLCATAISGVVAVVLLASTAWRTRFIVATRRKQLLHDDSNSIAEREAARREVKELDAESDEEPADLEDLAATSDARPEPLGLGQVFRWFRGQNQHRTSKNVDSGCGHVPGAQRIYVRTFGCPHNQSDGEYMEGQLRDYGYTLVNSMEECDACVVNSCTVKHPSETRAMNLVSNAQQAGKQVVLAGCVPSSDRKLAESLEGVSMLDVTQLDRIVDVVEEAVKGHTVKLLDKRQDLPSLALPKVRKDKYAEIITINAGCLGSCTFCKTKMARGKVVSYSIDEIVGRALQAASEGACQIELASEDMGAYGVDIGTNIIELMTRLSDALPPGVMLRTGMTNPPYIMQHIDAMVELLKRPNVHSFMHIPVQSGSDSVLRAMRREYTVAEFELLCDKLKAAIPDVFLLTDIICGFPAESESDWRETMDLVKKYKFQGCHASQFYARPGTPAARLKPLKSHIGKERWRECYDFLRSYNRNEELQGKEQRVWFSGTEEDHGQTVGRTKAFAKVLVPRDDSLLGRNAMVRITKSTYLHVEGEVVGEVV